MLYALLFAARPYWLNWSTILDWNKWHRNTTSRSVTETSTLYIFQSGLCTNQSSFTITIVNDLNTITPVSSSYCSAYELPFTLWQVFHPKRNKYSKYRTCSWNLNKHSWNKHYLCLVWRYNRNSNLYKRKVFTITIILFLHYQNIQTSLAALLTLHQLKWRCLLFKSK
jgi:hypothetical protein